MRVSDDLEIRLRSQAIRVYKSAKIQGPRFQRNYIIARDQKVTYMARHSLCSMAVSSGAPISSQFL